MAFTGEAAVVAVVAEHSFLNAGDAMAPTAAAPSSSDLFFFLGDGVSVVAAFLTGLVVVVSFVAERDGDLVNALASSAPRARLLVGVVALMICDLCVICAALCDVRVSE